MINTSKNPEEYQKRKHITYQMRHSEQLHNKGQSSKKRRKKVSRIERVIKKIISDSSVMQIYSVQS